MSRNDTLAETVEISPRFRRTIEERIAHLESGAAWDEAQLPFFYNPDQVRRQKRLIAVQRAEAMRMRIFLEHSKVRLPRPLIAL